MSPCSYCSRFSRFMFLNRSVRCKSNLTAKHAKIANKKGSGPRKPVDRALVSGTKGRGFESRQARFPPLWNFEESPLSRSLPSYHPRLRKTCESLYWFAFPCSRRSRCSRFKFLNRRVRNKFNRERRQNRESSYDLLLLVLTLPVVRGSCF